MKKISLLVAAFVLFLGIQSKSSAQNIFYEALKTCENYSQAGVAGYNNETFGIQITLQKARNNKCVYKEKIYQGNDYQMLTCNFDEVQLPFLSSSMEKFYNTYKKEIAKNRVFEAKMTTNAEIFEKYLINTKFCDITHSKKK